MRPLPPSRLTAYFLLGLILAGHPGALDAQQGTITGQITNEDTGRPVTTAFVAAVDAEAREAQSSVTDGEGRYRLTVPPGSYSITVSGIGYGTQSLRTVQVVADQVVVANFAIPWETIDLGTVTVSVGRVPERSIGAPAHVEVISEVAIRRRPTMTPVDHLRSAPGVDIITQGVQSTNVVVRGFNNIFSGALHTLTDHRIAGVPSLRVNVMSFVPATDEDIDRIEVVLGPGAALYGPNTANGVLHMITRSPLAETGTSVRLMGGERGTFSGIFRTSHQPAEGLGIKISGQYLRADEWEYVDPAEVAEEQKFASNPDFWRQDLMRAAGIDAEEANLWISRIGDRDYQVERWGGEIRADWAVSESATAVFTAGLMNAASQIELTGLGAGQARDWRYTFLQARLNWERFFAQVYLNQSDAGDTFLLRNGTPISDRSLMFVGQLQHRSVLTPRQSLTYGVDYIFTLPRTEGTINGIYEERDETSEVGAYIQSDTRLTSRLSLVLAGRVDDHSALPSQVFSPRAALVFQPDQTQAFRLTFNRAFSTPSSLNQFLDLGTPMPARLAAAGQLGYSIRVQGTGTEGFAFAQEDGSYLMRSPFTPVLAGGPTDLIPAAAAANYWAAAVNVAVQLADLPDVTRDYLLSLQPTPAVLRASFTADPTSGIAFPLAALSLPDLDPIREETQTTYEFGYRGLIGGRALVAGDLWYSQRKNFVTPLTVQTPFITLNREDVEALVVDGLVNQGYAEPVARAIAAGLAAVPLGVVSSPDVNANGAQLLATYTNVDDELELWGLDLSATFLLTDLWAVSGSASFVSDDAFETDRGEIVVLNAPKEKGSLAVKYDDSVRGIFGEVRARFSGGFPASSGVYEATACLPDAPAVTEPCVESFTLVDLNLAYDVPALPGASIQLSVQNLLGEAYRSFPGVPEIGRMGLLGVRYEF
ncbi:MAG: TonB-dependent receptor [Gemmatimonadota bacterium]